LEPSRAGMNATAEVDIWGIVSGFAGSRLPASGCRYSLGFPPGSAHAD